MKLIFIILLCIVNVIFLFLIINNKKSFSNTSQQIKELFTFSQCPNGAISDGNDCCEVDCHFVYDKNMCDSLDRCLYYGEYEFGRCLNKDEEDISCEKIIPKDLCLNFEKCQYSDNLRKCYNNDEDIPCYLAGSETQCESLSDSDGNQYCQYENNSCFNPNINDPFKHKPLCMYLDDDKCIEREDCIFREESYLDNFRYPTCVSKMIV